VATSEESCRNLAITNIGVGVKIVFSSEKSLFPPVLGEKKKKNLQHFPDEARFVIAERSGADESEEVT
jgi:hypothetical protein